VHTVWFGLKFITSQAMAAQMRCLVRKHWWSKYYWPKLMETVHCYCFDSHCKKDGPECGIKTDIFLWILICKVFSCTQKFFSSVFSSWWWAVIGSDDQHQKQHLWVRRLKVWKLVMREAITAYKTIFSISHPASLPFCWYQSMTVNQCCARYF